MDGGGVMEGVSREGDTKQNLKNQSTVIKN